MNNYAHIGGFLWGSMFHFFVGRPLKNKYHNPVGMDVRRMYLMGISLICYTIFNLVLSEVERSNSKGSMDLLTFEKKNLETAIQDKIYKVPEENKAILLSELQKEDSERNIFSKLFCNYF